MFFLIGYGSETISRRYRRRDEADFGGILILGLFVAVYYIFKHWQWTLALILILGSIGLVYYLKRKSKKKSVNKNLYSSKSISQVENYEAVQKGDEFERYVVDLFDEKYFTIVEWTTDSMRKHNRYVEADTRPDLLIRYNLSGDEFYVECKYRSNLYENMLEWSTHEQMNRYFRFAYEKKLPFFVIMGLGGTPSKPDKMYCVPLQKIKYPQLYQKFLIDFYHEPGKNFFWNGSRLH
jgi:hypothetical protein